MVSRQAVRSTSRTTIEKRLTRYARSREEIEDNITMWLSGHFMNSIGVTRLSLGI